MPIPSSLLFQETPIVFGFPWLEILVFTFFSIIFLLYRKKQKSHLILSSHIADPSLPYDTSLSDFEFRALSFLRSLLVVKTGKEIFRSLTGDELIETISDKEFQKIVALLVSWEYDTSLWETERKSIVDFLERFQKNKIPTLQWE